MIGISKLLLGLETESDELRYGDDSGSVKQIRAPSCEDGSERPVVVWNMTKRCNLKCVHCYSSSTAERDPDELSTEEGKRLIDDLADFEVPVILFSGGEPYLREDLFELASHARERGIRPVISTNGTLLTEEKARKSQECGLMYVGVSLDGLRDVNDRFRGQDGAFDRALQGIRNSIDAGNKTGLRFTITRYNQDDLAGIMDLLHEESVERMCMYHLDYVGRGEEIRQHDLTGEEKRSALDTLFEKTQEINEDGQRFEVLTVGHYADGAYLYMKLKEEDPEYAERVYGMLRQNGGDGTGQRIACVDWHGEVYANQFMRDHSFGNVRERSFSDIWTDTSDSIMKGLKNKGDHVKGRCASCRFLDICRGGSRVRARAIYDDIWAEDPACYLTDEEIGLKLEIEA